MLEKYRNKIMTPAEAVKVVKNGDWVDFGFGNGFPELFDEALAARRDELTDVKIRGGLVYRPVIHTVDCDGNVPGLPEGGRGCDPRVQTG